MKILAIRILNLASLEGLHEIDFTQEPLLSSGIFAITGPTGAGKSTILDALCLALYAKTPRYIQAKESGVSLRDVDGSEITQGDSRSILRDGTAEGFAEVDFQGKDGKKYRSRWSTYRAGRKVTGRLQSYSIELKEIDTQQNLTVKIKDTLDKITELTGLNFEQFTKSVLLAQGEFTAFLKADKDQKASLLEKLTGTEIYSKISERVFSNYSDQRNLLKNLRDQANNVQLLSPEQIEEINLQLKGISDSIEENKALSKSVNDQITAFNDLKKLQEKLSQHEENYRMAISEKENAQDRQAKISLIEKLQPVQHYVNSEASYQKEISQLNQNILDSNEKLNATLDEIKKLKEHADQTQQQSERYKQEWSNAQPLIKAAQKLDVRIEEKKNQKDKQAVEVLSAENESKQYKIQSDKTQEQLAISQNELAQIQSWQHTHQSRASIAENQQLILSKLEDASKSVRQTVEQQAQVDELEKFVSKNQILLDEKTDKIKQLSSRHETLKPQISSIEEVLQQISPEQLSKEQKILQVQKIQFINADKTLKDWNKIQKEIFDLEKEKSENQKEISAHRSQSDQLKNEIKTDEAILKSTEELVQKVRMETSESVEKLRAQLSPEQPCPVCGSTEHPYAEMHPAEKSVLNILEKELEEKQKSFQKKNQDILLLSEKINTLEKQVFLAKDHIAVKQTGSDELQAEWNQIPLVSHLSLSASSDIVLWLQTSQEKNQQELERIEASLEKYRLLSESLKDLQKQKSELEEQEKTLQPDLSHIEKQLISARERKTNATESLEKLYAQTDEVRELLQPYFNQDDWYNNWKNQPEVFTERLKKFALEWNAKKEDSEKLRSLIIETNSNLKNLKKLLETSDNTFLQKRNELDSTEKEIQELQLQRNQIFEGHAITGIESDFRQKSEGIQSALDKAIADLQNKRNEVTAIETSLKLYNDSLVKNQNLSSQNQKIIQNWLVQQQLSYSISELSQILNYSQEWFVNEKKSLRQIDDNCKSGLSLLQQAQKDHQKHVDTHQWTISEEELSLQKNHLESISDELSQTQFRLKSDLERDEKEKKSKELLFRKITAQEQITYEWESLNDLIGSAKGDKFKQLAQEYTLDILTEYSNVHLQSLSKRYLLQRIPGTLALQVKDLDMGEEIRSVYSLSGGESFLVSLGLALGLASLSSNKMRVESLFIDEGFGSLDPQTLNIAMDALENLYQQGRKVGVISHVQEMTERIPVQIKVSKLNTGRSTLEVIG